VSDHRPMQATKSITELLRGDCITLSDRLR